MSNIRKKFGEIFAKKVTKKLKKEGLNSDGLKNDIKNLKSHQDQLDFELELELYCKMNPESPLCKNRGKKMKW